MTERERPGGNNVSAATLRKWKKLAYGYRHRSDLLEDALTEIATFREGHLIDGQAAILREFARAALYYRIGKQTSGGGHDRPEHGSAASGAPDGVTKRTDWRSLDPGYCDEATDSGHSSSHGLGRVT
jgi:hypothetical protein